MGLNNDLSGIKVSINNSLILPLENKKANSLLIFGNTINFFGQLDNDGNLALNEMNNNDQNHFFWLVQRLQQKTKVYIIGEAEEKEYYERLFRMLYKNLRLKVYYKFLETTNDNPKGYLIYMKQFKNMKFDYIVGNPPFGSTGGDTLHLKCTDMVYDKFNKKMIIIMPFGFVTKDTHSFKKYQEKFAPKLQYVKEIAGSNFEGTKMFSTAIYEFTNNETNKTIIEDISGKKIEKTDLTNVSKFNEYENKIIYYLLNQNSQIIIGDCGRLNSWKSQVKNLQEEEYKNKLLSIINYACRKLKPYYDENIFTFGLLVNRSNGGMNGTYLTQKNGQIFSSYNEFIEHFYKNPIAIGYNCLLFKSFKEAENCKLALQNPLLRFCLYKSQKDQNITQKLYKYIPAIDWEDSRCLTDEGLLEMCGCPLDKAKEYAEYVKNYVETRDKEIESRKKGKKK